MKLLTTILALTYMVSCQDNNPSNEQTAANPNTILNGKWVAKSLFLSDATTGVCHQDKPDQPITIEFTVAESFPEQYKIQGTGSINSYFSDYQVLSYDKTTGIGKLKIGSIGASKKGGSPEMMQCEQSYFSFLTESTGFQLDNNSLKIGRIKEPSSTPTRDGGHYYYFERE
jgi:heat shock protein HslJ